MLNNHVKKCSIPSHIIENASKFLGGTALELFKAQMQYANTKKKGRRYSQVQRSFALGLYFQSARASRYLSKIFNLPTTRMLRYWLNSISMEVGWNEPTLELLKRKAPLMSDQDKLCGITFDAVSLKCGLFYDKTKDQIIGFRI